MFVCFFCFCSEELGQCLNPICSGYHLQPRKQNQDTSPRLSLVFFKQGICSVLRGRIQLSSAEARPWSLLWVDPVSVPSFSCPQTAEKHRCRLRTLRWQVKHMKHQHNLQKGLNLYGLYLTGHKGARRKKKSTARYKVNVQYEKANDKWRQKDRILFFLKAYWKTRLCQTLAKPLHRFMWWQRKQPCVSGFPYQSWGCWPPCTSSSWSHSCPLLDGQTVEWGSHPIRPQLGNCGGGSLRNEAHSVIRPLLFLIPGISTGTASLLFEWLTPASSECAQPQRPVGLAASSAGNSSRLDVKSTEFLSSLCVYKPRSN